MFSCQDLGSLKFYGDEEAPAPQENVFAGEHEKGSGIPPNLFYLSPICSMNMRATGVNYRSIQ